MSEYKNIGKLKEIHYETFKIEWEISDFLSVNKFKDFYVYRSPVYFFAESTWELYLFRSISSHHRCMCLHLVKVVGDDEWQETFDCKFGLKKIDGSVEYFVSAINPRSIPEFDSNASIVLIEREELLRRRHELIPLNTITVVCTLKRDIGHSSQAPFQLKKLDTLSENFKSLFADKDSGDVTLKVNEKDFKAHKAVLMARSSVFASMFHHDMTENQTGIIKISDCDAEYFDEFLKYLYSGKIEDAKFPSVLHLYRTADKYDVQELKNFCIQCMKECLTEDNVCDILILADVYEETKLMSAAQDFFNKNANKVVVTSKWESLLKDNHLLANKLIIEMTSKMKI